jgi:hypothetical protein
MAFQCEAREAMLYEADASAGTSADLTGGKMGRVRLVRATLDGAGQGRAHRREA